jgi:uncharacterized membrane protein
LTLSALTIIVSWFLVHTVFALHYAHKYYRDNRATPMVDDSEGLDFPMENSLITGTFIFSFVIGMTFQVSDVQITSRSMRRLALVQECWPFQYSDFGAYH